MFNKNCNNLRVLDIIDGTTVDGVGLRTSIYFAGCHHRCHGCHNPQSWDTDGGSVMTVDEIIEHIKEQNFNVTFSGGDPLYQMEPLLNLASRVRQLGKNIWCYTGFTYEEIVSDADMQRILPLIDVLVDGPYIESLRDISLHFRGSSNQRLIDVSLSTPDNIVIFTH